MAVPRRGGRARRRSVLRSHRALAGQTRARDRTFSFLSSSLPRHPLLTAAYYLQYKKAPWIVSQRERRASGAAMSIDALVHSNPTSPSNNHATPPRQPSAQQFRPEQRQRKPAIEKYFTQPQSLIAQSRKRRRSDQDRGEEGRRLPPAVFT